MNDFDQQLHSTLKERFGHESFRGEQLNIIRHVAMGQDALIVMPTGAGKSLCYQLPALVRGFTIVVSPLLALMKDQVDALLEKGVRATFINSSISSSERRQRMQEVLQGFWEVLYVAPERFTPDFIHRMKSVDIRLLAIDEAHCLSQWGHDFRPDYLRLGKVRKDLGYVPTIALTATATPEVQEDIASTLGISAAKRFITGFDRSNLVLDVEHTPKNTNKLQVLLSNCGYGPTLVYCATRNNVERVTMALRQHGVNAGMYHGGLNIEERIKVQEAFMNNEISLVVATNAFGMGVDKADIRCILHWDFPSTIEAYYQEIGRAGRDGKESKAIMLYRDGDRSIHDFFIRSSYPPVEYVQMVWDFLNAQGRSTVWMTLEELAECLPDDCSDRTAGSCLYMLQRGSYIRRIAASDRAGRVQLAEHRPDREPQRMRGIVYKSVLHRVGGNVHTIRAIYPEVEAKMLNLSREQYLTALRALQELGYVIWDPPDRSGGVEILRRGEKLEIEQSDVVARREREMAKVTMVQQYAHTQCRRRYLLEYFGQEAPWESCGTCDQCRQTSRLEKSLLDQEELETVQKILSVVARMEKSLKDKWNARRHFSKGLIVDVAKGKQSKSVQTFHFNKLKSFGNLAEWSEAGLKQLLDKLFHAGALEQHFSTNRINGREVTYKEYGITETGRDILFGTVTEVYLDMPKRRRSRRGKKSNVRRSSSKKKPRRESSGTTAVTPTSKKSVPRSLLEALHLKRRELARSEEANLELVVSDAVLAEVAKIRPNSLEEIERVPGMTYWKARAVGAELLEVVQQWR